MYGYTENSIHRHSQSTGRQPVYPVPGFHVVGAGMREHEMRWVIEHRSSMLTKGNCAWRGGEGPRRDETTGEKFMPGGSTAALAKPMKTHDGVESNCRPEGGASLADSLQSNRHYERQMFIFVKFVWGSFESLEQNASVLGCYQIH